MEQSPVTLAGHFLEEFLSESDLQDVNYNLLAQFMMDWKSNVLGVDFRNASGKQSLLVIYLFAYLKMYIEVGGKNIFLQFLCNS